LGVWASAALMLYLIGLRLRSAAMVSYHQRYERGKTVSKLTVIGKSNTTGTRITFKPDKTILLGQSNFPMISLLIDYGNWHFSTKGLRLT